MTMRSPVVALLWEQWQLTRVEAAQRVGVSIVAASVALRLGEVGPTVAFGILMVLHSMFWLSISKLTGGRFLDGYKPGFPLQLLYTRPVPTVVFVGVAMAYDAISCVVLYLVSAALVGFAFDQPLPLFSVAGWIVTFHLVCTCLQWASRNRVVQWAGMIVTCLPLYLTLRNRVASPLHVEFSLAENVMLILIGVVSFAVAVAGVARQRHGGASVATPRTAGPVASPEWLVSLFSFSCPTSSATRALVWLELRSSGMPVLAIGLGLAMLIFMLFAIGIAIAPLRPYAVLSAVISVPAMLWLFGGNALGIRHKQGRSYFSSFEATQPYGTAQLTGLRILVRSACMLVALIAVGVSVWASSSLVNEWVPWLMNGKEVSPGVLRARNALVAEILEKPGYQHFARMVVVAIVVALIIASRATFTALRARHPRRVNIGVGSLLFYGLALVLLAQAEQHGIVSTLLFNQIQSATNWIVAAVLILATTYLVWRSLAERLLTPRQVLSVVVMSAAFGAACLTLMGLPSVRPEGFPTAIFLERLLAPALLALMLFVLASWSLNRIRHM